MAAPSPDVLDFAKLLAPIPGDKPTGPDLRADASPMSVYYAIRDARRAARQAERPLDNGAASLRNPPKDPAPDWRPVVQTGTKVLAEQSKDLEVTAYLIEALVRLHGFAGLRDGLRLAAELVDRFWDGLYPLPDGDGMVTRITPLINLNGQEAEGTLPAAIGRIPITENTSIGQFCANDYQDANTLRKLDLKKIQARLEQGAVSLEMLQKAVAESSAAFYQRLMEDMLGCQAELAKMGAAVDKRCANQGLPTSAIHEVLDACIRMIKDLAASKLEPAPKAVSTPDPKAKDGAAEGQSGDNGATHARPLRTREDAFNSLLEIAEFFRKTEPQTIVAYALEQVVRWGRMPLPDLLVELIPEEPVRKNLFKQVGIQPPAKGGDSAKK